MVVFLNGQFIDEAAAFVSVFDRSFLYGDGLFETLRVAGGKPFRWHQHLGRLQRGADFLNLTLPFTGDYLLNFAAQLIQQNALPEALLRITVSRGVGLRGYSPKGANDPAVVMFLHPVPDDGGAQLRGWHIRTASYRLPANEPLAQFKTCNKLPQIMARAEADACGAEEALLLNTEGWVIEGSSSNLFWIAKGEICTPPLAAGILPGVTRSVTLELCQTLGLKVSEVNSSPDELCQTQGVFLSLSSMGIVGGLSLDGHALAQSLLVKKLHTAYWDLLRRECQ